MSTCTNENIYTISQKGFISMGVSGNNGKISHAAKV